MDKGWTSPSTVIPLPGKNVWELRFATLFGRRPRNRVFFCNIAPLRGQGIKWASMRHMLIAKMMEISIILLDGKMLICIKRKKFVFLDGKMLA
ncbi:hypothetical protein HQR70_003018 [Salmonella enterica]|nr:hypothetical protein [Salmonella enterica]EFU0044599.1 hypothetical protein [Salmonella enterica]EFV5166811.1 hypothetical protein [Salmonella enterica]